MNKLEEDYTYRTLRIELENLRNQRQKIEEKIANVMRHINAIKKDFKGYEESFINETME